MSVWNIDETLLEELKPEIHITRYGFNCIQVNSGLVEDIKNSIYHDEHYRCEFYEDTEIPHGYLRVSCSCVSTFEEMPISNISIK